MSTNTVLQAYNMEFVSAKQLRKALLSIPGNVGSLIVEGDFVSFLMKQVAVGVRNYQDLKPKPGVYMLVQNGDEPLVVIWIRFGVKGQGSWGFENVLNPKNAMKGNC